MIRWLKDHCMWMFDFRLASAAYAAAYAAADAAYAARKKTQLQCCTIIRKVITADMIAEKLGGVK